MQFTIDNNLPLVHSIHFPEKADVYGNAIHCEIWGKFLNEDSFTWIAETCNSP